MARYQNGMIYKLVNDVDDQFYVGSTCMPLAKRKSNHKVDAKKHPNQRLYKHLNEIGWDCVKIILIEKWPCEDKYELEKRERYHIEELKPSLNKNIPTRPRICEEHGKVRSRCKACGGVSICVHGRVIFRCKDCGGSQICEHGKRRGRCKDCGGSQICEHGKQRDQCKECTPAFFEIVKCGCGSDIKKLSLRQHMKSQKHMKWVEANENTQE